MKQQVIFHKDKEMASALVLPYGGDSAVVVYTVVYHIVCSDVAAYQCRCKDSVVGGVFRFGQDRTVWWHHDIGGRGI